MNNIEQAISFARQEYTRQGLDALYQKDFEEALPVSYTHLTLPTILLV